MPTVSVIVPVYKVEKYIRRCVDSILSQTISDFELILVDDGSPDNCGAICDEYAARDSRIRVLHLQNGGASKARNAGLDAAQGTYIAFCDSDDWWDTKLLECAVQSLENGNYDWFSFHFRYVMGDGKTQEVDHPEEEVVFGTWQNKTEFICNRFLQGDFAWSVWARVFRRRIIEQNKIRFCETCGDYAEDLGFCTKYLFCSNAVVFKQVCLYNYYLREGSLISNSKGRIKFHELNEVSYDVCTFGKNCIPANVYKDIIGVVHFRIMYTQYKLLLYHEQYRTFPAEMRKVKRRNWFRKGAIATIRNRKTLKAMYGKYFAAQIVNFSWFCLYRCWYPYMLVKRITSFWERIMKRFDHSE